MSYTLHLGDCLEYMKTLPDKSVDAVITDPPYFMPAEHFKTRSFQRRNFSDMGILEHFFKDVFAEFDRLLKVDGSMYVFCDGQSYPLFWYYAYAWTKSVRPLIWNKGYGGMGYGWRHAHEIILYAQAPNNRGETTGDCDVLSFSPVSIDSRKHPAEKPVSLIEKLVAKCKGVVLDPFMGSGTTGVACFHRNRDFIGVERDPEYYAIAERRIKDAAAQIVMPLEVRA